MGSYKYVPDFLRHYCTNNRRLCYDYGYDLRAVTTSNDISEMASSGTVFFAPVPKTPFGFVRMQVGLSTLKSALDNDDGLKWDGVGGCRRGAFALLWLALMDTGYRES